MFQPGQRLHGGRYELVRFLRAGGAGVVWAARDRRPRRDDSADVAIKFLDATAGGSAAAAREAEVAARVSHPNVVRVRDTFVHDGVAGMVMDLAVGSLADLVARDGPMRPPVAVGCALQACAALAEAHRAGVVHRDVKPHNLLVFPDGSVRLADFGAARTWTDGEARTRTGALLGSLPFMAPEQRRDPRAVRPATDVYALAVTLAWLLLGESPDEPWTDETAAQLGAVGVPAGLIAAIARGGARRHEQRPVDGAAFADIVRGCGVVAAPIEVTSEFGWPLARSRDDETRATLRAVHRTAWWLRVALAIGMVGGIVGAWAAGRAAAGNGRAVSGGGSEPQVVTGGPGTSGTATCADALHVWVSDRRMGPRETTNAAVADVDRDGALDVVFTNLMEESASVWWGHDGERTAPSNIAIGRSFASIAVGDVDGDARFELVVARPDTSDIAVVHRSADGRWQTPESRAQAPVAEMVTVIDWNADGRDDIAFRHRDGVGLRLDSIGAAPTVAAGSKHVDLARVAPGGFLATWRGPEGAAILFDTPQGVVEEIRRRGTRVERREVARTVVQGASRWLVGDLDGDARDELYEAVADGNLWRMAEAGHDAAPCLLATGLPLPPAALLPATRDGPWSAVAFDSCTGCESNHVFLSGTR